MINGQEVEGGFLIIPFDDPLELNVIITGEMVCPKLMDSRRKVLQKEGTILKVHKDRVILIDTENEEIYIKCDYCGKFHRVPFEIQIK